MPLIFCLVIVMKWMRLLIAVAVGWLVRAATVQIEIVRGGRLTKSGGGYYQRGETAEVAEDSVPFICGVQGIGRVKSAEDADSVEEKATEGTKGTESEPEALPEDFPAREILAKAGVATYVDVLKLDSEALGDMKGIGAKTLDEINQAMNAWDEARS